MMLKRLIDIRGASVGLLVLLPVMLLDAIGVRVGRFIRRTSLDELPQLINVLPGNMSFVGPRLDVPAQRAEYTEQQWRERHRVRPGLTGHVQATLHSEATPSQRPELDLRYVRDHSFWLDVKILLGTVRQLFWSRSF